MGFPKFINASKKACLWKCIWSGTQDIVYMNSAFKVFPSDKLLLFSSDWIGRVAVRNDKPTPRDGWIPRPFERGSPLPLPGSGCGLAHSGRAPPTPHEAARLRPDRTQAGSFQQQRTQLHTVGPVQKPTSAVRRRAPGNDQVRPAHFTGIFAEIIIL